MSDVHLKVPSEERNPKHQVNVFWEGTEGHGHVLLHGYDGLNYNPIRIDAHGNISTAVGDSSSIDAFGRQRIAAPQTIFDSKQIFDNQPLFWDDQEVSGSGTSSTYDNDRASTTLAVTASTAGRRVRQTFRRFNYQPGKSQLILMTGRIPGPQSGINQCAGYYDDNDGVLWASKDGVLYAIKRSSVSGSPVDTQVAQGSWSDDNLDGTGPSGKTLDPSKVQIMWFDLEWLGAGRVRMGFVLDGVFIKCHEFLQANEGTAVYMQNANLPLRYEIENDGTGGAGSSLECICGTVISEGGAEATGALRAVNNGTTAVTYASAGTTYAVLGIRPKSAYIGLTVLIERISVLISNGSKTGEWSLLFNPTVANTFTYNDQTNSGVQIATGAATNTVTNGYKIANGFAVSTSGGGGSGGVEIPIRNALIMGSAIDGTVDEIVLCFTPNAGSTNVDINGAMTWREQL